MAFWIWFLGQHSLSPNVISFFLSPTMPSRSHLISKMTCVNEICCFDVIYSVLVDNWMSLTRYEKREETDRYT